MIQTEKLHTEMAKMSNIDTGIIGDVASADEPVMDIAHVGHVELMTPKLDESARFFVDVLGMSEAGSEPGSLYLRGWDDYELHSLKLTASQQPGLGHVGFRTRSSQALKRRVSVIERSGRGIGWHDGDFGHGPAYRFSEPDGHLMEVYFETIRYAPPNGERPYLKNQAQRFPARGANVRRFDHFNLVCAEPTENRHFLERALGLRTTEMTVDADGNEIGFWMTATNKGYDLAYARDGKGRRGLFHHVAFALDSREEILRAADIFNECGVKIVDGPHKHAIQQTFYLYVMEPGGNRVELSNAGARLVLAPDWEPVVWTPEERARGQAWGAMLSQSFYEYATPDIGAGEAAKL